MQNDEILNNESNEASFPRLERRFRWHQRMTNRRFENAARLKNYPETLIRDKIERAGRVSNQVEKRTHI